MTLQQEALIYNPGIYTFEVGCLLGAGQRKLETTGNGLNNNVV